jgi:integrase
MANETKRRRDKGNGSLSNSKRKDGLYHGYVWVTNSKNEKVKKYAYAKTKQAVKAKLDEIKKMENEKAVINREEIVFKDFAKTFIEDIRTELAPRTIESYQSLIKNYMIPVLEDKKMSEIMQRDIQLILSRATTLGRSEQTKRRIQALTNQIFKNASDNNIIHESPVKNLKKIKRERGKAKPFILSEEEQEAFIDAIADSEYKALFYLIFRTGMRIGEALALEWNDIDFENNKISIRRSVGRVTITDAEGNKESKLIVGDTKTWHSARCIEVSPTVILSLEQHMKKYADKRKITKLVFSTSNCTHFDARNMRKYMRKAIKGYNKTHTNKIPEKMGFHTLRHTLAHRMYYVLNMKMLQICNYLGHYNEDFTSARYVDKGMCGEGLLIAAMVMHETENERAKMCS